MIKKLFLSAASIFLLWQSYGLLISIDQLEINSWGYALFLGWLICLYITGIFAFLGFAFPTQKLLPDSYYKVAQPKRLKRIYKFLNVDLFRQLLLATLWRSPSQRDKFFDGTKEGIANLVIQSKKSEFGHLIPFVILVFIKIYVVTIGQVKLGIVIFVINFIGNFYPIILQRYHRLRIQIIRKRQEKRN